MKKQFVKLISLFSVFVLLCCPVLHSFASALSATAEVVSAKIDPEVMAAFADGAETVKVYVWLNDIDQKQVDAIVEQKTGLRADNLAVIDENISDVLAARIVSESDNDKLTDETEQLLQAYLDRTAVQRTQERERTDLYTATRRAEAKAKYNEKSAAFLTKNAISSEKVIFNSNYAPMLILELTKQEVKALAARADVESVSIYIEETVLKDCVYLDYKFDNCEITRIKSVSGLSGQGVKIGNAENFAVNPNHSQISDFFGNRIYYLDGYTSPFLEHSTKTCMIHSGNEGIAHEAQVYTTGFASTPYVVGQTEYEKTRYYEKIEELISFNVDIINISSGTFILIPFYSMVCRWIDHIVSVHAVTVVVAAGNRIKLNEEDETYYYNVIEQGLASNVITVGSYHEVIDVMQDGITNKLAYYSCYNEGTAVQKPDVLGLGCYGGDDWTGTSFAAPFVTGVIALMLELRPHLSTQPHLMKAIVMASCHEKAQRVYFLEDQEEMVNGITNQQGAGVVNPYIAISIVSHGTYGIGVLTSERQTSNIKIKQPTNVIQGINVSLAWIQENYIINEEHDTGNVTNGGILQDLDLQLINNNSIIGISDAFYSSTEMLYCELNPNYSDIYTIRINNSDNGAFARYAYAWSVANARFQYSDAADGIGYLKNAESLSYLQADTTTLSVSQNSYFDGEFDQTWIIDKRGTSQYALLSAYE